MAQSESVEVLPSGRNADQTLQNRIDDRALPRWRPASVACALLSEGQWHDVTVLDISLTGIKVRGHWDRALPVTALSLSDVGTPVTCDLLILQATLVWAGLVGSTSALRFDVPDRETAARLLKFLSAHLAAG